jgi:hypothetical protein
MRNENSMTEQEIIENIRKEMEKQGTAEADINSFMQKNAQALTDEVELTNLIMQNEMSRQNNYMLMDKALQEQTDMAGDQVALLKSEMELTKAIYLGLGPTLDMQIKTVDAIERTCEALDEQIKLQKSLLQADANNWVAKRKLIALQRQKTELVKEEYEITKNLREGYLDAMQAFTNVEGFFSKIVLKQDYGMGEMLRQFGASGGFRVGAIGAGGTEPFARWKQGGRLQWGGPEEMDRRAQTYGEQRLPVRGAVNLAAAMEGGGMGSYFGAQEMLRQTGLPQMGQQVGRGEPAEDLFRKAIEGSKQQESPLVRAQLQSQFKDLTEKEKLTRGKLQQDPENVALRKELASIEGEKKQIMQRAQGPQGMSMGECCDKLSSRLDKIIEILSGGVRVQGTSIQGPTVATGTATAPITGPQGAMKPVPGVAPAAPVAGAASAATTDPELEKMRARQKEIGARIGQLKRPGTTAAKQGEVGAEQGFNLLTPLTKDEKAQLKKLESEEVAKKNKGKSFNLLTPPTKEEEAWLKKTEAEETAKKTKAEDANKASLQEAQERIRQGMAKEAAITKKPVHKQKPENIWYKEDRKSVG